MLTDLKICIASLAVSLLLAEGFLRLLPESKSAHENRPVLRYFWSHNYLTGLENWALRAKPYQHIRETATCGDSIDFDVTYKTNNLGFIDTSDYGSGENFKRFFAIAGDSYTAGTGAFPWITRLRQSVQIDYPRVQVYNLGFVGAGVEQFVETLKDAASQIPITDIIILAIAGDFSRRPWQPVSDKRGMWFCAADLTPAQCKKTKPHVRLVDFDTSQSGILRLNSEISRQTALQRAKLSVEVEEDKSAPADDASHMKTLLRFAIKHAKLLDLLNSGRHRLLSLIKGRFGNHLPKHFQKNYQALKKLPSIFPEARLYLVQFPSKMDASRGYYITKLREYVEAVPMRYFDLWETCDFDLELYHKCDHHFTERGYTYLTQCLQKNVIEKTLWRQQEETRTFQRR